MKRYVALLRGINISGKNKISMAELKKEFEKLAFEEVKIYFDYEAYGRDMEINGTFIQIDNSFVELY